MVPVARPVRSAVLGSNAPMVDVCRFRLAEDLVALVEPPLAAGLVMEGLMAIMITVAAMAEEAALLPPVPVETVAAVQLLPVDRVLMHTAKIAIAVELVAAAISLMALA